MAGDPVDLTSAALHTAADVLRTKTEDPAAYAPDTVEQLARTLDGAANAAEDGNTVRVVARPAACRQRRDPRKVGLL